LKTNTNQEKENRICHVFNKKKDRYKKEINDKITKATKNQERKYWINIHNRWYYRKIITIKEKNTKKGNEDRYELYVYFLVIWEILFFTIEDVSFSCTNIA